MNGEVSKKMKQSLSKENQATVAQRWSIESIGVSYFQAVCHYSPVSISDMLCLVFVFVLSHLHCGSAGLGLSRRATTTKTVRYKYQSRVLKKLIHFGADFGYGAFIAFIISSLGIHGYAFKADGWYWKVRCKVEQKWSNGRQTVGKRFLKIDTDWNILLFELWVILAGFDKFKMTLLVQTWRFWVVLLLQAILIKVCRTPVSHSSYHRVTWTRWKISYLTSPRYISHLYQHPDDNVHPYTAQTCS